MLARTISFTIDGTEVRPVEVEVDVCRGLPSFGLVGLPDTAVREARERVRAAMENSGYDFPLRRITASLAPADLRKARAAGATMTDIYIYLAMKAAARLLWRWNRLRGKAHTWTRDERSRLG